MRPRVIPADDAEKEGPEAVAAVASMRPRVIPADDDDLAVGVLTGIWPASMRPRVIPADDEQGVSVTLWDLIWLQ